MSGKPGEGIAEDPGILTVPNLLSLSRIPLGLCFLFVSDELALAVIAGVGATTDLLDGFIARITRSVSRIGVLLDPFCDKFFVLMGLVSFLPTEHLGWAGFVILILRDVFTGGVFLLGRLTGRLAGRAAPFRSRPGGKVATVLQIGTLFSLIFAPAYVPALILAVGAVSVFAVADYGFAGLRNVREAA